MIYLAIVVSFLAGATFASVTRNRQRADVDTERLVWKWAQERREKNPNLRIVR